MSTKTPVKSSSKNNNDNKIKDFRSLLKRAILMDKKDNVLFDKIPDILLERILVKNFNNNLSFAERILLNKYKNIDKIDKPLLEQKKRAIKNLDKASDKILDALQSGKKIIFLTDNDNDGSMAQSVFLEFFNALTPEQRNNIHRAYAQPIGTSRGLNKENIDLLTDFLGWGVDEEVLLVTADIGINNRLEQEKIQQAYPNMDLIVTDHHLPVAEHVIQENERSIIFNPQYEPTEFFKKKNISGANTLSVLLKEVLNKSISQDPTKKPLDFERILENMDEISSWSNLLDYVEADIVDMPLRPYTIKKALDLRALLNVSNSMGTFVTLDWKDKDWDELQKEVPELDIQAIKDSVKEIKSLNLYAQKLLAFHSMFDRSSNVTFTKSAFFSMLSESLMDEDDVYESPNPNYIAQLRPHIFRLSAIDNKFLFLDLMKDQMVSVFEDLRSIEKELIKKLQSVEMLNQIKSENSTIVYPKSPRLTKIFGRKLLNKIYNEENRGFYLTLDKNAADEYSGSMRSLYPMDEILPDEKELEDELGVDIEILGHSKAAGFKIVPRFGTVLDQSILERLNDAINDRIEAVKLAEAAQPLPFLDIDFASVGLVQRINTAVKAHLSNMNGLPCVLKLGKPSLSKMSDEDLKNKLKHNIWVTDNETSQQVNLSEVVKNRKYGYQAIQTDFHGNAFVIPVEQLRTVVEKNFEPAVKLSYMDDGVFIANQVVDLSTIKTVIDFKSSREDQNDLIGYYWNTYRDSNFIPLFREDFSNLPYFKHNKYGQSEFEHWEHLIISLLDKTNQDVLAVIDTEGTGLGQAPKCFNIGGTNIKIKEGSGFKLDKAEFDARAYKDNSGDLYLLEMSDIERLVRREDCVDFDESKNWRVFKSNSQSGVEHEQEFILPSKPENVLKITNYTNKKGVVLYNRTVDGVAFSFIIKDNDLAITPEFENLTGISHEMVHAFGTNTTDVDEALTNFYSNMKNADGKPAKIIFSAHNLPYDKGVIGANFVKFNQLMDDHVLCDTAKLSRKAKLAYDDTPVSSFEEIAGMPRQVYFYDSPFSSYSLSTFLDRASVRGKGGVYPDTTGRFLLRYNKDTEELSLIDKVEINEILLDESLDSLIQKKIKTVMPNNAVKFSVERLSQRAMIRNIILHDFEKPQKVDLVGDEQKFKSHLEFFQDQYHFDNTLDNNIRFFLQSAHGKANISADMLRDVGLRFLELNKDIQAKFHDGWIYEKVLSLYEPTHNEGKVPQDTINQINYYTDLPRKKIEKVLKDTIAFNKHFGISKPLVHEQHNNIRQRSDDGQGLSDTAYESVLPNQLAMMKYYNPYTQSSNEAVSAIIEENLKASMLQLFTKKDHQDIAAIDSFSMKQMLAYDREMKTDLVDKAQKWWSSGGFDGNKTPLRFKLGEKVLPPGSGVYGIPNRALTQEEINESSRKLQYILLNEQLRTAASLSRTISIDHGARLSEMAGYNDKKALSYKKDLMQLFERVDFQRKEATIKKLSEMMGIAFQGGSPSFTATLIKEIRKNPDLLITAAALQATHHTIDRRLGKPAFLSPETIHKVNDFLETLTDLVQSDEETPKAGGKIKRAAKAKPKKNFTNFDGSLVRSENFLPDLDIRRDEPLKYILDQAGPRFLTNYLASVLNIDDDVDDDYQVEDASKIHKVAKLPSSRM